MKKVEAYKCDYCNKTYFRKCDAVRHEKTCINNPARRACKTCIHSGFKTIAQSIDSIPYNYEELYCFKLNVPMSEKPYLIDCDEINDCGQIQTIPYTCEHYKCRKP